MAQSTTPAPAATAATAPRAAMAFDIPEQALASALDDFALRSGWPILFRAEMVAGRRSSAVQGRYAPEAALRQLLEGTGLGLARAGPADAYTLVETRSDGVDFDYGAWVQARLWRTLCADPRTAPGSYRVLLQFQIDARGRVQHARLLTSTGDRNRDAALRDVLARARIGRVPPAGMAQPLTMLVQPAKLAGAPRCDPLSAGPGPVRDE